MHFPLLLPESETELNLRVKKAREAMQAHGLEAMLLVSSANILYFAGGIFNGYIWLSLTDGPIFFIVPPLKTESQLCRGIRKPEQIPSMLAADGMKIPARVGLEFEDLLYSEIRRLSGLFPDAEPGDASAVMRDCRAVKTTYELEIMREDGRRQAAVYSRIPRCYKEGMTDLEFQIEIEHVLRREGCLGFPRVAGRRMEINLGSVLAGDNADEPSPYDFSMGGTGADPSLPVGASGNIMRPGTAVMVDMNGGFNGYQTDMTRVWSIGTLPQIAYDAHRCSCDILRDLEKFATPGTEIGELYRRACRLAEDAGMKEYFMGHNHQVKFIGHGVGIQLNEIPVVMERNRGPLAENMTIALEPKFVLPGIGAVGVENTYIVTPGGLENITPLDEEIHEL